MTKYQDFATKTGDRVLSLVGDAEQAVVKSVATVSEWVGSILPEMPTTTLTENIPAPREIVDEYFAFAERALKQRKAYAKDLVKAFEPISSKLLHKKAVKAAPKAAATA
ncbi:MAG: hypothetical protein ACXVQY_01765 [Actinomycetota bacterium]